MQLRRALFIHSGVLPIFALACSLSSALSPTETQPSATTAAPTRTMTEPVSAATSDMATSRAATAGAATSEAATSLAATARMAETLIGTPVPVVGGLPDLRVDYYVVTYAECPWGGPGQVAVHVSNGGDADAGPFTVTVRGKNVALDGLPAGQSAEATVDFESGPVSGVRAEVDSGQQVDESDEENNVFVIVFTPPPPCATATP